MVGKLRFDVELLLAKYPDASDVEIAEILGVNRSQISLWRLIGLTVARAELLADRACFWPTEIWPDWYNRIDSIYEGSH